MRYLLDTHSPLEFPDSGLSAVTGLSSTQDYPIVRDGLRVTAFFSEQR